MKRTLSLILSILTLALPLVGCADIDYRECLALMEQGEYALALDALHSLGDYENSAQLAAQCEAALAYEAAEALMAQGEYKAAHDAFIALGDYAGAYEKAVECVNYEDYLTALAYAKAENYPAAIGTFAALGAFLDSQDRRVECEKAYAYKKAGARFSLRDYRAALTLYREAGDIGNSADMAAMCQKRIMVQTVMQRLISFYRYNASYTLPDILSLLTGVSGFERADELKKFISLLNEDNPSFAAREYSALTGAYLTPALARALTERFCDAGTLSGCAALALCSFEASASLADKQRFDEMISQQIISDENMAAFASFGTGALSSASTSTSSDVDTDAGKVASRIAVYERDLDPVTGAYSGRVLMGAYRMLPQELIPEDFSQVEYIVLIDRGGQIVHTYDGGALGVQETCSVSVVHMPDMKEIARYGDFVGELPPDEYTFVIATPSDMPLSPSDAPFEQDAPPTPPDAPLTGSDAPPSPPDEPNPAVSPTDEPVTGAEEAPAQAEAPLPNDATQTDATPTELDPIEAALADLPSYVMGAGPDETLVRAAVRTALISLAEKREGDYGYIETYGCVASANGIPEKEAAASEFDTSNIMNMKPAATAQTSAAPTLGAVITSYRGTDFVFPKDLGGLPVTGFSKGIFKPRQTGALVSADAATLRSELALPKTLTAIPEGAFLEFKSLSKLKLPASVTYIGADAFPRGVTLDVADNSYAHYWAVANAWPHTVDGASPTDESAPLKKSGAEGTVAYPSVSALAALVPWPEEATPLSASSDGRLLEFGNVDEVRYVLYVRELISSSLFERFDGFTATPLPTATLRAGAYFVTVTLSGMTMMVEIWSTEG